MSNLIESKIADFSNQIIILNTKSQLPASGVTSVVYFIKTDESNTSKATSYTWSGSAFVKLSDVATDMVFYDTMTAFPTTGFVDTLYVLNSYQFIYTWDIVSLSYIFLCQATTVEQQIINNIAVKYSSLSIVPVGIKIGVSYTIGFDTSPYVITGIVKRYMTTEEIMEYFLPLSGLSWSEIIGLSIILPEPISSTNSPNGGDMLSSQYDPGKSGVVNLSNDCRNFMGHSVAYFTTPTTANATAIANKIKTMTYVCTVANTTNVVHGLNFNPLTDELQCIDMKYSELMTSDNYTLNSNLISIDLTNWSLAVGDSVKFMLYTSIK